MSRYPKYVRLVENGNVEEVTCPKWVNESENGNVEAVYVPQIGKINGER
ncbi:MAG: hypothetical protein ABGX20_02050 [Bacillus sp. (in: firmicutes)]